MEKQTYAIVPTDNPVWNRNSLFVCTEDLSCPRFSRLRRQFRLDRVVEGEKDEFRRILLLRHWIKQRLKVDEARPAPGDDVFAMLDRGPQGGNFHCAHFMVVQNAVMNAFGYVTRCLQPGPGQKKNTYETSGNHGVNEVWSNQYCKWFVSDAEQDFHFEKNGVPFSALEIREELLRNKGRKVGLVQGPERKPMQPFALFSPHTYAWVAWEVQGNRFSGRPTHQSSTQMVYDDRHFRTHTWYRDGRKHWAYDADFFVRTRHRDWIEWTPNVLEVLPHTQGNLLRVHLRTCTPGFREYQVKEMPDGRWRPCDFRPQMKLTRKRHEWLFRSRNMMGVCGPEYRLVVERREG